MYDKHQVTVATAEQTRVLNFETRYEATEFVATIEMWGCDMFEIQSIKYNGKVGSGPSIRIEEAMEIYV